MNVQIRQRRPCKSRILKALKTMPEATARELSVKTGISTANLMRNLNELEYGGVIRYKLYTIEDRRRIKHYSLIEKIVVEKEG